MSDSIDSLLELPQQQCRSHGCNANGVHVGPDATNPPHMAFFCDEHVPAPPIQLPPDDVF